MPGWLRAVGRFIKNEPAMVVGVVAAGMHVGVTYGVGVDMTPAQKAAADALVALLAGGAVRSQVVPVAKLGE